ncbi:MAG: hypothetical protein E6L02_05055 [Thaumarchaeota archaeon]|nr:MAG: hypothetical protein E6L02_05055 [Nitrososphaerota archaeon]
MSISIPPNRKFIGFKPLEENWSYYSLADGLVLGLYIVATKIYKVEGPNGVPQYYHTGQVLSQVFTAEEYRQLRKSNSVIEN